MAETTFRSPGFFEQEIDLTTQKQEPVGTPAGIVGTSEKGPAFVPITVGSFSDFAAKFGNLDHKKFGPYAVQEFLRNKTALTYVRVLGAGANDTTTDISTTQTQGTVKNAGFKLVASTAPNDSVLRSVGAVQFIVAKHLVSADESVGFPVYTNNDSAGTSADDFVSLVRGMIFTPSGTRVMIQAPATAFTNAMDDFATIDSNLNFKLYISSSSPGYSTADGNTGLRVYTASLNPSSNNYIGKILNTDPEKFIDEEHLLYADFSIENELATVSTDTDSVGILSGSSLTSQTSGDTTQAFRNAFGRFDTRYTTPKTTKIISQPFGDTEYDLFSFESIDDGAYANNKYKISIADIRKSSNAKDPYGTFTVVVRAFDDTDTTMKILERFPNVTLNPSSESYIARKIGDKKVFFNFDADRDDERRLIVKGKYPNRSGIIRVIMEEAVERKTIPTNCLPFGFRGLSVLKTSDSLTDTATALGTLGSASARRLYGFGTTAVGQQILTSSIVPPLPYRFKVTRGPVDTGGAYIGKAGSQEIVDGRLHWGVKFESTPETGSVPNAIFNTNIGTVPNPLVSTYAKFLGIQKLDTLVTGSGGDRFNNNKFTLARVTLYNGAVADLTGSIKDHMIEAAYIRNGVPDSSLYRISDGVRSRITFASLLAQTGSIEFNRFAEYAKFTTILAGGFDGVNILDRDAARMSDQAASSETGGVASTSYVSPGLLTNVNGTGKNSNAVKSYLAGGRLLTDPFSSNVNIIAIPGIRDSFVTDEILTMAKEYSMAMFVMDIPKYDENGTRLFDKDTTKPDVRKTKETFEARAIDNNYGAVYFPDVVISDTSSSRKVKVPSSVVALGALSLSDKVSYPWFAPAGFNRGSLSSVTNVDIRLNTSDRDTLYDARINPIATFPREGFVIWGQKTLQQTQSALDRVNVRRLMLEVKRIVMNVANKFVFEQNTQSTRDKFKSQIVPLLGLIQAQSGIDKFSIVIDTTNNTPEDIDANRLNGRITVVPTRTTEFIAIDFVITNSGVSFS